MTRISFSQSLQINKYAFNKDSIKKLENNVWLKNLWPLVYIISDEDIKEAYIGESTNAFNRLKNHLSNSKKSKLNTLHLITSDKFNKSATLDIESYLIQYMSSDGKFNLQNGNAGLSFHNYYQRDIYFELFHEIWAQLKDEDVTIRSLKEIDNSDLFKYSPYKSLTNEQYSSMKDIINSLINNTHKSIFVSGSAGTGKTILAIFLIKLLVTDSDDLFNLDEVENNDETNIIISLKNKFTKPEIALVIPMTSLRKTLKKVFKHISGLSANMVIGPSDVAKKRYDILLVDEAHRLKRRRNITNYKSFDDTNKLLGFSVKDGTELDWILKQSENQIFFYDSAQSIKPSDIEKNVFDKLLDQSSKIELYSQLRVKGGNDYISYIDELLNVSLPIEKPTFSHENYELELFDSLDHLISKLDKKEKELGLCRLVAGYSWEWKSKKKIAIDIEIDGVELIWNSTNVDWINSTNAIKEVGCIHTTQGYDLNYTGVIFGNEISYNPTTNEIVIIPENYYDRNGKNGIKDLSILKEYIINIYKTLMYRGIKGTYVYVCDENLREYFRNYISVNKSNVSFKILPFNDVKPFIDSVPFYDISAAAGDFSELQTISPSEFNWIKLPNSYRVSQDYFVCKVVGESMNKIIPSGSWCLFKKDLGGSREGKIVLVQSYNIQESDFGSGYTVKEYHSVKEINENNWKHKSIVLKPKSNNLSYKDLVLKNEELSELKVLGVFVSVLY